MLLRADPVPDGLAHLDAAQAAAIANRARARRPAAHPLLPRTRPGRRARARARENAEMPPSTGLLDLEVTV